MLGPPLVFIFLSCGLLSQSVRGNHLVASHSPGSQQQIQQQAAQGSDTTKNKDELEAELVQLKESGSGDSREEPVPPKPGELPRPAEDDVEEELTEVRPLDIPLHVLESVEDSDHRGHISSTVRTFAEPAEVTTASIRSRFRPDEEFEEFLRVTDSWEDSESVEHEHSGFGSNLPPPPDGRSGTVTTEQYSSIVKKSGNDEEEDDDDGSDEDDDDDDDDDDEDDDEDDDDEEDDDDTEDVTLGMSEEVKDEKKRSEGQRPAMEDSIEHGRHWKAEDHSEEEEGNDESEEEEEVTRTESPKQALARNLAIFLGDSSHEMSHNNTRGHVEEEADLDVTAKLDHVRELQKKAHIPEKLVDAVSPKADEDLLELMVRIAEDPAEWQQVHHFLQKLDQDLMAVKRQDDSELNRTSLSKEHRGRKQQADKKKKKKKKKKQRQKGKSRAKMSKEEEIRREELEKAGILPPANALFKGNEKVANKETTSKGKVYQPKTFKELSSLPSKIKDNSLESLEPAKDHQKVHFLKYSKGIQNNVFNKSVEQKPKQQEISAIDSAIAYLSKPKNVQEVTSNNLPEEEVKPDDKTWPEFGSHHWGKTVEWSPENSKTANVQKSKIRQLLRNSRFEEPLAAEKEVYSWKEAVPPPRANNPKEERRYFNGVPVYSSPDAGWSRYSLESLKHGNSADNIKPWPQFPAEKENSIEDDNWTDVENSLSKENKGSYSWPNYPYNPNQNNIPGTDKAWSKPNNQQPVVSQTSAAAVSSDSSSWMREKQPNAQQKTISSMESSHNGKQWPHFAYHRVTSSPQVLAQRQEAAQRARHRNAYIAVSVIAPPGRNKSLKAKPTVAPLPDKMDQILSLRSEKMQQKNVTEATKQPPSPQREDKSEQQHSSSGLDKDRSSSDRNVLKQNYPPDRDLEEQLVDMAVNQQAALPWSHARHLDKIQEQLKTLSAMGEKLKYHWLEKERLLQILRDGGKNSGGFYRKTRGGVSNSTTTTVAPSNILPAAT